MPRDDESGRARQHENSSRIDLDPDVLARRVGDELVLVHLGRNEIFALNSTGARLWELLVEGLTVSEAVARMADEYDVDAEQARAEADSLLSSLSKEGLVRVTE